MKHARAVVAVVLLAAGAEALVYLALALASLALFVTFGDWPWLITLAASVFSLSVLTFEAHQAIKASADFDAYLAEISDSEPA